MADEASCWAAFPASRPGLTATVRVLATRQADLLRTAGTATAEEPDADGWVRVAVEFGDMTHAEGVLWSLAADVEVLAPADLRATMARRVAAMAAFYDGQVVAPGATVES